MVRDLLTGRLLVANPRLYDPNFHRSIVLLLEHGDDGAVGLVLNRPTEIEVEGVLPEWRGLAAEPAVVFVGGPVSQDSAVGLARLAPGAEGAPVAAGRLTTVDLSRPPAELEEPVEAVRVFSGYSGWAPQQLEAELEEGAWLVVDAEPGDAMAGDPEMLWETVLRRQGGETAWLATYPPDVTLN